MFERILLPLDGTTDAEAVLGPLARLPRRPDTRLVFLRAVEPLLGFTGVDVAALLERDRAEARDYFRGLMRRFAGVDVRVGSVVREGAPADVIARAAGEERSTLVAMATAGLAGLSRWLFGGTALRVLRRLRVPLLLSRSGDVADAPPLRRILLSLDGDEAVSSVAALARASGAEVAALGGPAVAARLAAAGVRARWMSGDVAATAAAYDADLVAIGPAAGLAARLLRSSAAPLLVLPRDAERRAASVGA